MWVNEALHNWGLTMPDHVVHIVPCGMPCIVSPDGPRGIWCAIEPTKYIAFDRAYYAHSIPSSHTKHITMHSMQHTAQCSMQGTVQHSMQHTAQCSMQGTVQDSI